MLGDIGILGLDLGLKSWGDIESWEILTGILGCHWNPEDCFMNCKILREWECIWNILGYHNHGDSHGDFRDMKSLRWHKNLRSIPGITETLGMNGSTLGLTKECQQAGRQETPSAVAFPLPHHSAARLLRLCSYIQAHGVFAWAAHSGTEFR